MTLDGPEGPRLHAVWSWPDGLLAPGTVEAQSDAWLRALTALTEHARHGDPGGWTPSDLPLVDLDQAELDELQAAWRDR
ncbi:hypothetical protein [Streptomyces sp. Tu 3180]|uniref:hypothetical protein n=1 Tax=Streptomyces sp. Tu 3180 TaxID=2682611 RepID=UPI001358018C|nr:hypothetical protein [Streptomyces sp. Tu 3180]KAF3468932.1 hypothetical protein GL259_34760 [Streptomyces sp. Tu 3180]